MTKQARKLLKKLKEAQQLEDLAFGIDFDGLEAVTLCMDNEDVKTVDISEHGGALQTTLDYLDDQGYIEMGQQLRAGAARRMAPGTNSVQQIPSVPYQVRCRSNRRVVPNGADYGTGQKLFIAVQKPRVSPAL